MSLTISAARIVEESDSPLLAAPDSWPRRRLGDVATILNGFAFKSTQFVPDGGMPLIRIRDIRSTSTAVGYVGDYQERYIIRTGELLVGMDGDFNCARWAGPEALLNQRVCKITPDAEMLDLDYLTVVLPEYLQAIHDYTSSTTVTHLSSRDVASLPLPLPAIADQRAFAELVGSAATKGESAASHLASARRAIERFRGAVLAAACSGRLTADWRDSRPDAQPVAHILDERSASRKARGARELPVDLTLPELPPSYTIATLGACTDVLEYGTSKKCSADPTPAGIPVLRMGNIQDGSLDFTSLKYCDVDDQIERLMLQDGDLLFNRTNSPELVGKSAVYRSQMPASFASYLIRVQFDERVVLPDFANYWLNSAWGRAWAQQAKTDGVSQSNINGSKLALMPIPLPPVDEQAEIVATASQMLESADELLRRVAAASRAVERSSKAFLAKSLRGELIAGAV